MNIPEISVIIPAFNEEAGLDACLQSIAQQKTSYAYETILIDNNSTDKTSSIGKKYPIRVIKEKRQGRAYARQRGMDEANGKILIYTEADCVAPSDWIDSICTHLKNHPKTIACAGSFKYIDQQPFMNAIGRLSINASSRMYKLLYGTNTLRGTNFAVRKSYLQEIGGFSQFAVPFDDLEAGNRLGKLGHIAYLPDIFVYTSSRRIKGRMLKFVWEFIHSYFTIFIMKKQGDDNFYQPIRTT